MNSLNLQKTVPMPVRANTVHARKMLEASPAGMLMIGDNGAVVFANSSVCRMFGYSAGELVNQPVEILVPDRVRSSHASLRDQFFRCAEARQMGAGRDLTARRKDGTEFPVEIGLNPIETDDGLFVVASLIDVTERRRNEDRLRVMVEAAPTANLLIGEDGGTLLVNSAAERLFGWPREELLDRPLEDLLPERYRAGHKGLRDRFQRNPSARPMGEGRELFALRRDGTEVPVEIGLSPMSLGEEDAVLCTIVDISSRLQVEEAQRTMAAAQAQREWNQHLERLVAERTAEIAAVNEALGQSNEELQQFAYVASHDLQAPLHAMAGFAQLLELEFEDELDDKARRYIGHIVDSSKRMGRMIQELLAYSRVDSRARPFTVVDLNAVISDVAATLSNSIEAAGGKLTHDELPRVSGDPSQLTHLFQNLVENGFKYNTSDTPTVHVSASREPPAEVASVVKTSAAAGDSRDGWWIAVRDNGIGIDPKYHDQVFDIFKRLHGEGEYPGTGIGLAVARRIARRHGGELWISSKEKEGSTFYFSVGRAGGARAASADS